MSNRVGPTPGAGPTSSVDATSSVGATTDAASTSFPAAKYRIVLIGVDHARASPATAATSARPWQLPDGVVVNVDGPMVGGLITSRASVEAGDLLAAEHSISGLVPFVAAAAPGAVIVPLAVRPNAAPADVRALAAALDIDDPSTRVVAAVDFAHGLSVAETAANGRTAVAVLAALDVDAVGRWDDAYADGRGALQLAMELAERAGATSWTTLAVTDASALTGWAGGGVTGYVVGCWGERAAGGALLRYP
ncbi:MAG: AmmeMemoRadiSam system protein B [Ardenticatenales bacterium]|nr:AmmeMemoRadiSam system protein B [Ardenticatenales bacterium]